MDAGSIMKPGNQLFFQGIYIIRLGNPAPNHNLDLVYVCYEITDSSSWDPRVITFPPRTGAPKLY